MGKRKSRSKKKNKQINNTDEPDELTRAPHSFVIHRGVVGKHILELTKDFRRIMEPFTASSLKSRKKNSVKDFVSVAGVLHVSHLCIFTRTYQGAYMKIARLPQGPTLTFWVHNFSLAKDVVSMMKKQYVFDKLFRNSPLIVLNSFSGEGLHMKLMSSMFQNMLPTINLTKVKLSTIRRCILLNYNPVSKLIDFRHYAIKAVPVGISKSVKKLVQSKVPNLGRLEDISEFVTKSGQLSESEAEDDPTSHVTLPQDLPSRGNKASGQSAIRLIEIGPRLTLQLEASQFVSPMIPFVRDLRLKANSLRNEVDVHSRKRMKLKKMKRSKKVELMKIEEGLLNGEVLFHEVVHKTEEEKQIIKKRRDEKRKLKEKRRRIQEENKKLKEKKKQELKAKSLKGMQKRSENEIEMHKAVAEARAGDSGEDDDANWYRKEVGKEPDSDLFATGQHLQKKRPKFSGGPPKKKQKTAKGETSNESEAKSNKYPRFGTKRVSATKYKGKFLRKKGSGSNMFKQKRR